MAFKPRTTPTRRTTAYDTDPLMESWKSKLIPDPGNDGIGAFGQDGAVNMPDVAYLKTISNDSAQNTTDATSILQMLPDIEQVIKFRIASILSPKDLSTSEVSFTVDRRRFPLPISGAMIDVIADHFTNTYSLKKMGPGILRKSMFVQGSAIFMVLPESSIDDLINGASAFSMQQMAASVESMTEQRDVGAGSRARYFKPLGFLGPGLDSQGQVTRKKNEDLGIEGLFQAPSRAVTNPWVASLEGLVKNKDFKVNTPTVEALNELDAKLPQTVTFTDNFNVLKVPAVHEAKRLADNHSRLYNPASMGKARYAIESGEGNYVMGGLQGGGRQMRSWRGGYSPIVAVKTKNMINRPSVGHATVLELPAEAVIPIYRTPDRHQGYFVLLDAEGYPLRLANRKDIYNSLTTSNNGMSSSSQSTSQMLQMASNLSMGITIDGDQDAARRMARTYGDLITRDAMARVAGQTVESDLANFQLSEDVYATMLARSLKGHQTQILYVPAELMIYIAFDYAENGTGRSSIERTKMIGTMRVMLTFANVMAGIKNSVSRQKIIITPSPNEPDPAKTLAQVLDEFTRRRNVMMPFVANDPADIISYINMAGVEVQMGDTPGVPATKVDIEDKVSNRAKVDHELDEQLRDRQYLGFAVTPTQVLATNDAELATQVVTNNQLYAQQVINDQDQLMPFYEKFVSVVSKNSSIIMNELRDIVSSSTEDIDKHGEKDDEGDVTDRKVKNVGQEAFGVNPAEADRDAKIERIVLDFLDAVVVSLPRPDSATTKSMTETITEKAAYFDECLKYVISDDIMTQATLGGFAGDVKELQGLFKAYLMREFMSTSGIGTEAMKIVAVDEDGNPELNLVKAMDAHNGILSKVIADYVARRAILTSAIKHTADDLNAKFPNGTPAGGDGDAGGGGGGFDAGGGGDTSFDSGGGFDEAPPEGGGEGPGAGSPEEMNDEPPPPGDSDGSTPLENDREDRDEELNNRRDDRDQAEEAEEEERGADEDEDNPMAP